jgi:hypothetical protein
MPHQATTTATSKIKTATMTASRLYDTQCQTKRPAQIKRPEIKEFIKSKKTTSERRLRASRRHERKIDALIVEQERGETTHPKAVIKTALVGDSPTKYALQASLSHRRRETG